MQTEKMLIGIDSGGTGTKVGLFTAHGRQLGIVGRKVELSAPAPGWTERDPEKLWGDTASAIRELLDKTGALASNVAAVGVTGHGNGLYLVDREGKAVRPAINSTDSRGAGRVAQIINSDRAASIRRKTLQGLWPGQPEVLLHWLRAHEPSVLTRASAALMCKDYLRLQLTGQAAIELTDMATTNLVDVRSGDLDDELFDAFEIAEFRRLFPEFLGSTDIGGFVTAQAASLTGLLEGTPVSVGTIDMVACALGSGSVDPDAVSVVAGTWSINQAITDTPPERDDLFMVGRFIGESAFLKVEASPCSAGNFDWYVSAFKQFGADVPFSEALDRTARLAAAAPPGAEGLLFLPYIFGSRETSRAKGTLFGLDSRHTSAHVARGVMEGIAFEHRAHLERLVSGTPYPSAVRLSGGVARSEAWQRIFADCLNTCVEVSEADEPGALGAAVCAAVSIGMYSDATSAVRFMTRVKTSTLPNPDAVEFLNTSYQRRKELYGVLSQFWESS